MSEGHEELPQAMWAESELAPPRPPAPLPDPSAPKAPPRFQLPPLTGQRNDRPRRKTSSANF